MGQWKKSYPNSENEIKQIPDILRQNFEAIENAYNIEHYSPASGSVGLSGEHRLGSVGAIYEGTTVQIAALTTPMTGALAYDTTLGVLVKYNGSAWIRLSNNYWSRFKASCTNTIVVTAGASASTLIFDTEDYDTLSEYDNATGIFTTLASGYYLLIAQATMIASGTQLTSVITSATGTIATTWLVSGAGSNLLAIDDYPTPNDDSFNTTQTCGDTDTFSGSLGSPPIGADPIIVSVSFRSRQRGCICNNTCYGEDCTCNNICYGHSCTCNNTCYTYGGCFCDNTCYVETKSLCVCYAQCYGYSPCTCNNTCYVHNCATCYNTIYGLSGCSCDALCYAESETKPAAVLRKGGVNYLGASTMLTSAFTDYSELWALDPSTGLSWTPAGISAVQGFGYTASFASAGCSADMSQCYLSLNWFPPRPVMGLHIYKNDILYQSTYRPLQEAVGSPYQTVNIFSMLFLTPGDAIKIAYTKTMENDYIFGNSTFTYFAMHRLPVDFF